MLRQLLSLKIRAGSLDYRDPARLRELAVDVFAAAQRLRQCGTGEIAMEHVEDRFHGLLARPTAGAARRLSDAIDAVMEEVLAR